jgi:ElaB/YqjD/DUF883 family membrane-anchored ribosome-binding protein
MTDTNCEHTREQIADIAHKASRAATDVEDAIENGIGAARHAAKQGCYAAEEFLYSAKKRVQRHPFEIVAASFAVGIASGALMSWIVGRNRS